MAASRSLGKIYREEDAVSVSRMTVAEAGSADDDEEGSRPIDEEKLPTEDRVRRDTHAARYLFGRLPVIATLEDLDEASLKLILTQPKNALVKQYQRLFEMEGVHLTMAAEAIGAIARKALDRKTGARGLRSIIEAILLDSMFDLPSLEGVKEVVISQQVVDGTARPLYMYGGGMRAS